MLFFCLWWTEFSLQLYWFNTLRIVKKIHGLQSQPIHKGSTTYKHREFISVSKTYLVYFLCLQRVSLILQPHIQFHTQHNKPASYKPNLFTLHEPKRGLQEGWFPKRIQNLFQCCISRLMYFSKDKCTLWIFSSSVKSKNLTSLSGVLTQPGLRALSCLNQAGRVSHTRITETPRTSDAAVCWLLEKWKSDPHSKTTEEKTQCNLIVWVTTR